MMGQLDVSHVAKTIGEPDVLQGLVRRLGTIRLESVRRWGTLTPHEMLCHLGDATDMALGVRPRKGAAPDRSRPLVKLMGLWSPIPWPHGWQTNPAHDPRAEGTRPSVFAQDLARAVSGLEAIARAAPGSLIPTHAFFGSMSVRDSQRWAGTRTTTSANSGREPAGRATRTRNPGEEGDGADGARPGRRLKSDGFAKMEPRCCSGCLADQVVSEDP